MNKKILFTIFSISVSTLLFAQDSIRPTISTQYGYYTFFQSKAFTQYFYSSTKLVPSISIDLPLSSSWSINTKIVYLYHKNSARSDVNGWLALNEQYFYSQAAIEEYIVFPRANYNIVKTNEFSIGLRLGAYLGYINNYYDYYIYYPYRLNHFRSENDYFAVGASGGMNIQSRIPYSRFYFFANYDIHYAKPGEKSFLKERDGYLIDFGFGVDL